MQRERRQAKADYRKHLSDSQNFITSKKLLSRIVGLSNIDKNDTVVEIGTGKGHLTETLCKKAGSVYSVEIDRRMYENAKTRLAKYSNLKLICGDFLNYRLPVKDDYKVFANIPYFITTQIIDKLTNGTKAPTDIWLIMEKGAAKRFMGSPKETEKSLLLKVNWEMKIRYHFRREDFHPAPSVDSVLVHFRKKETPDLSRNEYDAFRKFIDHAMKYAICGKRGLLTKRQVAVALKQAGLPHAHEDGLTLYVQWLCLFRCYQKLQRVSGG
ncbi:MAG: 23S ribosomal RNA methyltransferase Erm [Lachnospiraceae bacterium]|nr:23S ribosomal RNA methyltransferase Erm [Lachnospiraceae bacterium]